MKNVSWRFQNWSMILSASVYSQCMGLWHGMACQRKLGYVMKLKHSSETHLFVKFFNEPTFVIWFWRIIVKCPEMLSPQFIALFKPCKPEPNLCQCESSELPHKPWPEPLVHISTKPGPNELIAYIKELYLDEKPKPFTYLNIDNLT